MKSDLDIIKKKYGEDMSHLCRSLFPTILEETGELPRILLTSFNPSKFLYKDIVDEKQVSGFKDYILKIKKSENDFIEVDNKTPEELLEQAGYKLYECHTEEDIQSFKKYYAEDEELCTFNGNRLKTDYVFFAVKNNVSKIRREDFKNPERQDEYGTSVISIQFSKGMNNTLSIKNRYNHTVSRPDATFGNNLDNIITGLTKSFEKKYNLNITKTVNENFELNKYVKASDNKLYRYNLERNNVYYCPDNIIINNFKADKYEKEKYVLFDDFILDLVNKKMTTFEDYFNSFNDYFHNMKNIEIKKYDEYKIIKIDDGVELKLNKYNELIGYKNEKITHIEDNFLKNSPKLKELYLPNVVEIGDYFLSSNTELEEIVLPKVEKIGSNFLYRNKELSKVIMPKVKHIGNCFLEENRALDYLSLPELEEVGFNFMYGNSALRRMEFPKLKKVGFNFCFDNYICSNIDFPELEEIGNNFMANKLYIETVNLPNAKVIGDKFLYRTYTCNKISLPKVKIIGDDFLQRNMYLKRISLPKVVQIGNHFLSLNKCIKRINFPYVLSIGDNFLLEDLNVESIKLKNAIKVGSNFIPDSYGIKEIDFNHLQSYAERFLDKCTHAEYVNIPKYPKLESKLKDKNIYIKK